MGSRMGAPPHTPLTDALLASPDSCARTARPTPTLTAERALADGLAAARRAWPTLALADDVFLRFAGERLGDADDLAQAIGELQLVDLYLACACARGLAAALALFETHVMAKLNAPLQRLKLGDAGLADLKQQLRVMLFVPTGGAPPKIAQYSGRAPLASWVQVVATRAALRMKRGEQRLAIGEDEPLLDLPAPGDAPEVSYLKQRYQGPFRDAFLQALAALEPRDRTLLRQSFIDGLSIDELGRLYSVHRATASRWVVAARRALLSATRARLMERIQVSEPECDHIMGLVRSRLDVTLRGLMATKG
jgi:RNA polymerase sigma-70 factor (ECF subfamily)